jgi:enoyl-CoA hydratase/carnithine racemase
MAEVLLERPQPGVALLTLNRPEAHNALTTGLQSVLDDHLATLEADPSVGCIVITGAGDAAFSAGYDIHELAALSPDEVTLALLKREEWMWRFASLAKPVIAALPGITFGAGALIACAVDLRIGCERTVFKFTAGKYGGANATWSLPVLVGMGKAKEILYTSKRVEAAEAQRIGLLNAVVGSDRLLAEALAMAATIAANPPDGLREIKRLVQAGPGRSLQDRYEAENVVMRTTLKPKPMTEIFSGFLDDRGATKNVERPL